MEILAKTLLFIGGFIAMLFIIDWVVGKVMGDSDENDDYIFGKDFDE